MNLANKLTMLRVFMIPLFLWVLLASPFGQPASQLVSAGIFVLASLTDWLDGYIARSRNLVTNFGKFLDPLADKLLVCAALVALVELGRLAGWVVIVLISREFIITGFRLLAVEKNIVIAAGFLGKLKTATQMVMLVLVLLNIATPWWQWLVQGLVWLSVLFSVLSAVEYVYTNRQVLKDTP